MLRDSSQVTRGASYLKTAPFIVIFPPTAKGKEKKRQGEGESFDKLKTSLMGGGVKMNKWGKNE